MGYGSYLHHVPARSILYKRKAPDRVATRGKNSPGLWWYEFCSEDEFGGYTEQFATLRYIR